MARWYTPPLFWGIFLMFLSLTEQNTRHKRNISPELPRIMTQDGHLVFKSGVNHNISFQAVSGGAIRVGNEDLSVIVQTVKNNKQTIEQLKTVTTTATPSNLATRLADVEQRLANLQPTGQVLSQLTDLTNRIGSIENVQQALNNRLNQVEQSLGSSGQLQTSVTQLTNSLNSLKRRVESIESWDFDGQTEDVRRLERGSNGTRSVRRRIRRIQNQVNQLRQLLTTNECSSNPCRNGGSCVDTYNGFICRCPSTWQGVTCELDVNECSEYAGTDLGCQNGATCVNTQGGFTCRCTANWHGIRCTERHDDCTGASNQQMCGHGTCVNVQRVQPNMPKYTCICDAGWTNAGSDPSCTVDVNECTERPNACSVDPQVPCINLPGSFQCGSCPAGYEGNGFACADINECAINNGGCSLSPRVDCVNTRGSRTCGPCPSGYQGNGVTCTWVGLCGNNNGGCHPMASCSESPGFGGRVCTCPSGYFGNGIGNNGCIQQGPNTGACATNPCQNGALCQNSGSSFRCVCNPGFAGTTCQTNINECASNPCQNGGTCTDGINGYTCQCTSSYTGTNCQDQQQSCGGTLTGETGTLTFPTSQGETYPHGVECAWELRGTYGKILILTFTEFHVEQHPSCNFDYLQIHDGPTASQHRIGKYCGNSLPNGGTINSTTHQMYLWFHSDDSIAHDGFTLTWRSALPVCGGVITGNNHGIISSPGYPGNYPNDRDCVWRVSVDPGNNIVFAFAALDLEAHPNCSHDHLQIRDGSSDNSRLLGTFCNGSLPGPITTTSPHGYVHFHSDHSVRKRGFQLTYAGVSAGPQCGGTLTDPSGTIMSPNFPSPYNHDASCVWMVTVHQGDQITLTFVAMDLEHHSNCQYDYLLIRDGPHETDNLLGRWCGNEIPATLTSTGNNLYIEFRSDVSTAGTGFKVTYTTGCGGTFTETEGIIKSPYYPDAYPGNKECVYIISLPVGSRVTLTFNTFDIEDSSSCTYDYIEIRDGPSADSDQISRLCGQQIPEPVTTTQNNMWIKFVSDGSVHNQGFQATYSASSGACGGLLSENTGSFTSPGHPNVYPHGVNCTWLIRVNPGLVIRLTFNTFSIEDNSNCIYDYVEIFDNSTMYPGSSLGRKCGSTLPPVVTSSDNVMTVQFVSDSSIAHEGFSASYVALNASTLCGNILTDPTGLITSPNYPNNYPHNRECVWKIVANDGNQILLNVTDFILERHRNCQFDYLEIRNGGFPSSPLVGTYCGTTIDPIIRSHSNRMYIKFKTDISFTAKGFQMYYDSTASGCGADLTSATGSFVSPNYPAPYSHNSECFWTISVARGSTIQLVFVDFDIENHHRCGYDYVEVREGGPHGQELAHYCGQQIPAPVNSNTNKLWIKYRTDYSVSGRGFHASYFANCNTRLTSWSGVIESPNFPSPYYHNRNCTWIIQTTLGNSINVSFSHFDIESHSTCNYDFLQIRDGDNMNANEIGTYCGEDLPPVIASTGDALWVNFMSDISVAGNGFRLEYVTNGCGGYLTTPTGSFTSPGYPNGYPHRRECIWTISLLTGNAVELTITDFELETHTACRYDVLQVFEGSDVNGPDLTNGGICHVQKKPQVLTAQGNVMFVRFVSDSSVNGKGFSATYRAIPGGCGGNFSTPTGTILSKNYPNNYPHNALCEWLITVRPDQTVVLTFEDFEMEAGACQYDYVAAYDGQNGNSTEIFRHCGTAAPDPGVFRSTGNQMFIRFRTDNSVAHRGFKATYTTGCGGEITAEEDGVITSPNYPNAYSMMNNCTWIIRGAHSSDRITLTFTHMDLERYDSCIHDYVTVYDGDDTNGTVIGTYCGTRIPAPLTSQGSAMAVKFVSDASVQMSGFRALYTKSVSSCGGNFTAEHGSFTSPGYPNEYPLNTECIWTVYASPGNKIEIAFSFFSLEDHLPNCNMDYLELREGNVQGRLIGRYCGNQVPSNLTAVNGIWAKFRSDDSFTQQGFIAQYSSAYGGSLTGSSGQVASPRYPNAYPNNADYVWIISTDVGTRIRVTFTMIDIEGRNIGCMFDYVEFRDGDQADSPVLNKFCGSTVPNIFYSTTNQLRVAFHSDIASFGLGFLFYWEATTDGPVSTTLSPSTTQVPGCGGIIYIQPASPPQTITSPGYPSGYAERLDCVWQIQAPQGFRLWSNITDIDLESHGSCDYDYVKIFDNRQARGTELGIFCGREGNAQPIITRQNEMAVEFKTDYSVNRTGFSMTVKTVCGGVISGTTGRISSDNYPNSYLSNSNCSWLITVPTGRTIRVQFNGTFNIAGSGNGCQGDFVQLFNGRTATSPALGSGTQGKYCGTSPPSPMETNTNRLYVRFISNSGTNAAGFSLVFSEIHVTCGGHLTLTSTVTSGVFMSPNYPAVYPHNVDCTWVITAPANERIQIEFMDNFSIEPHSSCNFDFIELRDGGTTNSQSLGKFCGRDRPGTVKSTGNVMFARFRTDSSVPRVGFKSQYKIATCGGTIKGQSGYIQSPNFPSSYDNNLDCEWYVHAPTGHYMTFNYLNFNLQWNNNCSAKDYVEIRQYNATGPLLQRSCGSSTPPSIDTSDSFAYVRFKSDGSTTSPGFKLAFHASTEECGGDLTTPVGTFSSPNFPGRYPHSRTCEWRIKVPKGRRVTLRFDNFNIESHSTCRYDYVAVFNGIFRDSPTIQKLCGESNPGVIESYGNTMKVVFKTDGSISNGGFSASYTSQEDAICGGTLTSSTGNISSNGYPTGNYSNNEECIWVIQNQNVTGSTIMLWFQDFSLETHGDCVYDFIEIREGIDENAPLVGRFCGNASSPVPIFTPMPNLWIRFRSDFSNVDTGFLLKYKFTDCGGVLTSGSGVITSPNFPNNYNHSDACAWLIRQPEGYRVNVHFGNFSLETHTQCRFDFVELLNGGLPTSPSIGKFCGNSTPADFVSQSNAIRVVFNSDYSVERNGFLMSYYQSAGGCGGLLHGNIGLITSPNHPQSYPNSVECEWDINVQRGYHLILTFIPPFDLETHATCQYDYVEVDDSLPNNTLVPRGRWCNNLTPPQQISSSHRMVVRFRSDQNTHGTGFAANWTVGCGAIFSGDSGIFTSPGYPNGYGHNLLCNYTILANPGRFIVVQFDERIYEIEGPASCPYDSLTVYEGNSTSGRELGKFCGTTVPQPVSGRDAVFLQFKTDRSVTGKGFRVGYQVSDCGGELTGPHGGIRTPTHPVNYHHNANCTWLITVSEDRIVSLKFNQFELEAHQTCDFDYVDVYDGGDLSSPSIGRFCGEVRPDILRTTGNKMLVNFVSDWSVSAGGFTAGYWETFGESQGCGGVLNSTSGRITSVDAEGDGKYEHNLDCRWRIIVGDNKIVRLTIEGMNIEMHRTCYYDYIQVIDGLNMGDPQIGKYCGDQVPPVIKSTSNVLLFRFYTDSSIDGAGFNATYVQEDALCGGTLTASESPQTLSSPGYPSPVFRPMQCRWTIDTPESDQQVLLTMTNLDLMVQGECTDEYLEFRDTPMGTMGRSVHYCGNTLPDAFDSLGNTVQVNLKMMGMASSSGFTLKYQIASCNRTYSGSSGQIYSPGWPGNYPVNSYCEMRVTSPPGTSLTLYFNAFTIEPHPDCRYDSLLIRNGSNGVDLANLCGNGLPDPIFVPGNTVWMKFQTDESITHPGYFITYTAAYNGIGCGGNITGINGSLTSPGYPTNNTLRQTCRWLISAPARRTLTVRFTVMNVFGTPQCDTNYVEVYNGRSETSPKFSRYCSNENIAPLSASSNQVLVKYVSDGSGSAPLFRLTFSS